MPVQKFAEVALTAPVSKKVKQKFRDDVTMLVVGAEENKILLHQTETQSYTISGEMLVSELRDAGIDVEDWVARELIAPLGQLAERAIETDPAALFIPGDDEDEDEEDEPLDLYTNGGGPEPEVQFNDVAFQDTAPTNLVSAVVPNLENAVLVKPKVKAKAARRG